MLLLVNFTVFGYNTSPVTLTVSGSLGISIISSAIKNKSSEHSVIFNGNFYHFIDFLMDIQHFLIV